MRRKFGFVVYDNIKGFATDYGWSTDLSSATIFKHEKGAKGFIDEQTEAFSFMFEIKEVYLSL